MKKDKADTYQVITDKIIKELERGCAPWLQPWSSAKANKLGAANVQGWQPHNAVSGHRYQGINTLLAWAHMSEHGLDSGNAAYLTYNQAKKHGGYVPTESAGKGCQIVFWSKVQGRRTNDDGSTEIRHYLYAKTYTVWHISQTVGVTLPERKPLPEVRNLSDDSAWMAFVGATGVDLRHGGDRAYYAIKHDYVQMPVAEAFATPDDYKATALHELTHWTGHETRMARQFGKRFGDNAYAVEELVAELGAAFLCADHGVANPNLRHAAYIGTWLKALKEDNRVIITAASQASKAAQWIDAKVYGAQAPAEEQQEAALAA